MIMSCESPKKCVFLKGEIDFLGMLIGNNCIKVNPEKVMVLQNWPNPRSVTEVWSFLGILQFIRRFIPKAEIS